MRLAVVPAGLYEASAEVGYPLLLALRAGPEGRDAAPERGAAGRDPLGAGLLRIGSGLTVAGASCATADGQCRHGARALSGMSRGDAHWTDGAAVVAIWWGSLSAGGVLFGVAAGVIVGRGDGLVVTWRT